MFEEALRIRKKLFGKAHLKTAEALQDLAIARGGQSRAAESESLSLEAYEIHKRFLGAEHPDAADCFAKYGRCLAGAGKNIEAEKVYRSVLETRKRIWGENCLPVARMLGAIADTYSNREEFGRAEVLERQALKIFRTKLGKTDLELIAKIHGFGTLLRASGKYEEAEAILRSLLKNPWCPFFRLFSAG